MRNVNSHRRSFLSAPAVIRLTLAATLLMAWALAASAYTLVLRDGRQIEVPPEFVLTRSTLTYEISPGFNKTVQLILIDVAATERANHEASGAFFKHAEQKSKAAAPSSVAPARITLTNRELESIRRRRLESEQNYERRRIQLGLPSIEDSRRQRAQEEENMLVRARARALDQANDEAAWRARARALRSDIVATDAEIRYLRARLSEVGQFPLATHSLITSVLPLVPLATHSAVVAPRVANPGVFVAPGVGSAQRTRRGQVWTNPGPPPSSGPRFGRPLIGFGFPFGFFAGSNAFGLSSGPFDYLEDAGTRANLSERLDALLIVRTGLEASWRELEDQARDARVPQVWLEP
jgi:hypothetical protein